MTGGHRLPRAAWLVLPVLCGLILFAGAPSARAGSSPPRSAAGLGLLGPPPIEQGQAALSGRSTALFLGLGAAALASKVFENEADLARILDGSPADGLMDFGNTYGEGYTLGGAAAGLWLLGRSAGDRRLAAAGRDLGESLLLSWAAVWSIKFTINAERPNGGPYSFPSGHTATAFAAVPVVTRYWGRTAGVLASTVAAGTALGRMEERRHYLADVLVGAAIGLVMGSQVIGENPIGLGDQVSLSPDGVSFNVRF